MLLDRTYTRDRMTNITRWTYTRLRKVESIIDPLGTVTLNTYCDCGALESGTRANGTGLAETTDYLYDQQSRLIQVDFPDGSWKTNKYDLLGRVTIVGTVLGTTTNTYDNLDRPLNSSNAFGQIFAAAYDAEDNTTSRTDANGVTVTMTYDDLDRIRTRTYPDTGVEAFGYTANVSGPTSYTNQLSKVTTYAYDKLGRKTTEVVVALSTNTFTFGPASDLLTLSDGKSQVTTWGYTIYGQVASKKYANNTTNLVYSYDASGRLTNRWSQAKGNTAYEYDADGNLKKINYPTSADVTFAYDSLNRSTNEVVAGTFTNAFTYHLGGAVATEDGPWPNDTLTYYTNTAGLRSGVGIQQPVGSFTNGYSYDSAGRLSAITSHSGNYTYDYCPTNGGFTAATRLIRKLTLPAGSNPYAYITNSFDNNGRELRTQLFTSADVELNDHEYVYNVGNQRTKQTYKDDSYITYTYDDAGELRTAYTTNAGVEITAQRYMYGYDAAWNMTKRTNNAIVTTYTVNNLNQPTGGIYQHDSNGNMQNQDVSGTIATYAYDDENRLISATQGTSSKVEFYYDARSRLRSRAEYAWSGSAWVTPSWTRYIYDGMLVVQERDGSNVPQVTYTRGFDVSGTLQGVGGIGGMLARSSGHDPLTGIWDKHRCYHADANGNITYQMTSSQTLAASYRYDPFGLTISSSGAFAAANTYRFSRKELNVSSGLYYYGYRFYNPLAQRWLNRDPLNEQGFHLVTSRWVFRAANEVNLYTYVEDRSTWDIDPLGLVNWGPVGGTCCNNNKDDEWVVVGGPVVRGYGHWEKLPPGTCTAWNVDCDGMTCQAKFYKLPNVGRTTSCPKMNPKCGTGWPGGTSPSPKLMIGNEDPPPGSGYGWAA